MRAEIFVWFFPRHIQAQGLVHGRHSVDDSRKNEANGSRNDEEISKGKPLRQFFQDLPSSIKKKPVSGDLLQMGKTQAYLQNVGG